MQYRVLFADRSPIMQALVEEILQREGFDVKTVGDGQNVLQELNSFKPHVVITDISLRGLDGYCLCKEIKEMPSVQATPVILLAGAYDPFDEEYAKLVKADDYILKPFESLELVGKIRKLLNFGYSAIYDPPAYSDDAFISHSREAIVTKDFTKEVEPSCSDEAVEQMQEIPIEIIKAEKSTEEEISTIPEQAEYETNNITKSSGQMEYDELRDLVIESLDALIAHQFKITSLEDISSSLREQIKAILYEIAPQIVEEILRDKINIVITSLMEELQVEIKNALPSIVESTIRRKFEKAN